MSREYTAGSGEEAGMRTGGGRPRPSFIYGVIGYSAGEAAAAREDKRQADADGGCPLQRRDGTACVMKARAPASR